MPTLYKRAKAKSALASKVNALTTKMEPALHMSPSQQVMSQVLSSSAAHVWWKTWASLLSHWLFVAHPLLYVDNLTLEFLEVTSVDTL